jgi:hypothetical protein
MILRPSSSVTLGNLRYDSHASAVEVCLGFLPRGGSAEIRLPASARFDAGPGDDAQIDLDGGEGSERVLTGKVREVVRTPRVTVACLYDAGGLLGELRPSATFENQSGSDIVRQLASEVAVTVGRLELDLDLPAYVGHPRRTAAEHVAELCRVGASLARVTSEGDLEVIKRPAGPPEKALLYGREFTEYRAFNSTCASPSRFAMAFGPSGTSSAPTARLHTKDAVPASASPGGRGVLREPVPMIRTASAADNASKALQEAVAARSRRLEARCFLLPGIRPGQVVEVQSLPDGLSGGPWLITRVTHRLAPAHGGETMLEAESADAESLLGGLVGAALGAIGGLL